MATLNQEIASGHVVINLNVAHTGQTYTIPNGKYARLYSSNYTSSNVYINASIRIGFSTALGGYSATSEASVEIKGQVITEGSYVQFDPYVRGDFVIILYNNPS